MGKAVCFCKAYKGRKAAEIVYEGEKKQEKAFADNFDF